MVGKEPTDSVQGCNCKSRVPGRQVLVAIPEGQASKLARGQGEIMGPGASSSNRGTWDARAGGRKRDTGDLRASRNRWRMK